MSLLDGKVAIVTGGASGLGRAIVERFSGEGAQVVIADVNETQARELSDSLNSKGRRTLPVFMDITDLSSIGEMVSKVIEEFEKIDILVNNAGIYTTSAIEDITEAIWDQMVDINLKGTFFTAQAALPYLKQSAHGKIVNIASTCIFEGSPQMTHYTASKAGVMGLTRALANELGACNINVNAISPGMIVTEKFRSMRSKELVDMLVAKQVFQRPGAAEDIVGPILFLASQDSNWVTGQNLVVDGGMIFN